LAPGAHVDVLVYPDPPAERLFFLPRQGTERTRFRIVFATAGATTPHSEVLLSSALLSFKERRNLGVKWPREGDVCLPEVGCDAGFTCNKVGRCAPGSVPGAAVLPREVEVFGGPCSVDADCLPTLACVQKRCASR
jgi:hypothetical protein